jgi:hypothetical protein
MNARNGHGMPARSLLSEAGFSPSINAIFNAFGASKGSIPHG